MQIFIIGINGISMRSIAYIMQEQGHIVFGFDDNSEKLPSLKYSRIIPCNTSIIVYSSAIKENHPLRIQAQQKNIPTLNRTQFFIKHMPLNEKKILVAGAHGKTTTSAMIAWLLGNKSYYIGGILIGEKKPTKYKLNSKYIVIETDESDQSFLEWNGQYKILLNFDYEHMITYKTKENIQNAYYKFVINDIENTKIIISEETKNFLQIPDHKNITTYGDQNAHYVISEIQLSENNTTFKINNESCRIPLLGAHNAYNFTAIFALFKIIGLSTEKINTFPGIQKRMQFIKYPKHNLPFILDYGHHPKEIQSVLSSLKRHFPNKEFDVVFEPHKPSRILDTLNLWPQIFKDYTVWLYPLFIADEQQLNNEKLHFSTQKFFEFLLKNKIKTHLLDEKLHNLPLNLKPLICFSAGKLSSILSKY